MRVLTNDRLLHFFTSLAGSYEVRLPILLPDGTRTLGLLGDGPLALEGGKLPGKPTAAFFPHHGPVFAATGGGIVEPSAPERPLFVAGFTHRDLDCLRFIDRFFAVGWRDDIYYRLREGAVIAGVSGYCGPGGSLLPVAGGDCDLEFVWEGTQWLVVPYTATGIALTAGLPDTAPAETMERLKQASGALPDENEAYILRAAALIQADKVPDLFWADIGDRCIACTACNLACPTCNCFDVQDWRYGERVERSRMWDSCQLRRLHARGERPQPLGDPGAAHPPPHPSQAGRRSGAVGGAWLPALRPLRRGLPHRHRNIRRGKGVGGAVWREKRLVR